MDIDIKSPFWSPAGASGFILDWDGVIAETRLDFTRAKSSSPSS